MGILYYVVLHSDGEIDVRGPFPTRKLRDAQAKDLPPFANMHTHWLNVHKGIVTVGEYPSTFWDREEDLRND